MISVIQHMSDEKINAPSGWQRFPDLDLRCTPEGNYHSFNRITRRSDIKAICLSSSICEKYRLPSSPTIIPPHSSISHFILSPINLPQTSQPSPPTVDSAPSCPLHSSPQPAYTASSTPTSYPSHPSYQSFPFHEYSHL